MANHGPAGIIVILVFTGLVTGVTATEITGCTVIDTPGTYELVNSIFQSTDEVCFKITTSDVTIDGKDHVVVGVTRDGYTTAVKISSGSDIADVTIRNMVIQDWVIGIAATKLKGGTISGNVIEQTTIGIQLNSCTDTVVQGNTIQNWYMRIAATNLKGGTISGNVIAQMTEGIQLNSCTDTVVQGNTIENTGVGIHFGITDQMPDPTGNTIAENQLKDNDRGIFTAGHDNRISKNTIRNSASIGIVVMDRESHVEGNFIDGGGDGIRISGGQQNWIKENDIWKSQEAGICLMDDARGNTIWDNSIYKSEITSIFILQCSDNTFVNNYLFSDTNFLMTGDAPNTWNTQQTPGKNIVNGPYLGGNYWGQPNGMGFSQICFDADPIDGICDSALMLHDNNIDELPLADLTGRVVQVTPDADTSVNAGAGYDQVYGKRVPVRDLNFGGSSGIVVQRGQRCMPGFSFWEAALIRFNLSHIAPGVGIRKATLNLTQSTLMPEPVGVHRVLLPWTEREATFNRPCTACTPWSGGWDGGVNFVAAPTDTIYVTGEVGRSYTWDVTADVQTFVDGLPNHGWMLRSAETRGQSDYSRTAFYSRESTVGGVFRGPVLEIEFGTNGGGGDFG